MALAAQLERRRAALEAGARHVGWKLGVGERERIGGSIAVGHLTSATLLEPGASYPAAGDLHADCELAVELGRDLAPASFGVALELVDLTSPPEEGEAVVAANVFHRAVAFGPWVPTLSEGAEGSLAVAGELRATERVTAELAERLAEAGRVLAAAGERLRVGDRIITGSIVQIAVRPGDGVAASIAGIGEVGLRVV